MSIADKTNFQNASAVYRTLFQEAFVGKENSNFEAYTHQEGVTGTSFEYRFLSALPRLREWAGNKQFKSTRANKHRIEVKDYEASTSVSKVDWNGDPTGVGSSLRQWLSATRGLINAVVVAKLLRGATDTCYDGQPLFSSAHPNGVDGATQSNTSTNAFSQANYRTAVAQMRALKDEGGAALGIKPDLLMVGPALEYTARDVIEARSRVVAVDNTGVESGTRVAAAAIENVSSMDGVRLVIEDEIAGGKNASGAATTNYWFLMDSRFPCMVVATLEALTPKDDVNEFKANTPDFKFSIEGQMAIGYGLWQGVYGGLATA